MVRPLRTSRVPFLALVLAIAVAVAVAIAARLTPAPVALGQGSLRDAATSPGARDPSAACPLEDAREASRVADDGGTPRASTLVFFWGVGCPHCEQAKPFVDALEAEDPTLRIERVEVRRDAEGRRRFLDTMSDLGVSGAGVPTFVIGRAYVVGYVKGETDREVTGLVRRARRAADAAGGAGDRGPSRTLVLPLLGTVDPTAVSLPALTLAIGLVDGVNPCAMWVLIVLLGILLHVKAKRRMVLYAAAFIVTSGVVYFVFMTAWTTLFRLVGFSRLATMILGGALLAMGLVNLKELVWFKKGPSLVIPTKAKPGLFRRMRAIAAAASLPAALAAIFALGFVVNLIELGCTIGLPAVYTRILTLREPSSGARYAYLALYNAMYVVPLFVIAITFIALRRRLSMTDRTAKALKAVSGLLLIAFGALFLFAPDLVLDA